MRKLTKISDEIWVDLDAVTGISKQGEVYYLLGYGLRIEPGFTLIRLKKLLKHHDGITVEGL